MTVLLGLTVLTALCTGYHFGRRAGSRQPPWRKRTSRLALGRLTAGLVVLVIVRRMQRKLAAQRAVPAILGLFGYRPAAHLFRRRPARRLARGG